uniref:MAX dimerization protein 1 n=2 Tax=Sus scrofa TaxID=9823 RepID=A0A8D0U663_PIG
MAAAVRMNIQMLLEAADYLERREREAEHGYASMLPYNNKDRDALKRRSKSKKNNSSSRKHTFPTHPGPTSRWEQYFSLQNGHLERMSLGWHSLGKKLQHHSFSRTKRYNLFLRSVLGARAVSRSPKAHFPSKVGHASCLWNIFFSYLRDKRDLHFPLNTHLLCLFLLLLLCFFFPQISDIWSNSNLFSCLTFSNN